MNVYLEAIDPGRPRCVVTFQAPLDGHLDFAAEPVLGESGEGQRLRGSRGHVEIP